MIITTFNGDSRDNCGYSGYASLTIRLPTAEFDGKIEVPATMLTAETGVAVSFSSPSLKKNEK